MPIIRVKLVDDDTKRKKGVNGICFPNMGVKLEKIYEDVDEAGKG